MDVLGTSGRVVWLLLMVIQNGCPWDDWTCRSAANLEILKYARENGCPWNGWVYRNAESKKDLGMLKYARDNDCPELPTYLITGTDGITKYLQFKKFDESKYHKFESKLKT